MGDIGIEREKREIELIPSEQPATIPATIPEPA